MTLSSTLGRNFPTLKYVLAPFRWAFGDRRRRRTSLAVLLAMTMPSARGLFQRAIAESAPGYMPVKTLAYAESQARRLIADAGLPADSEPDEEGERADGTGDAGAHGVGLVGEPGARVISPFGKSRVKTWPSKKSSPSKPSTPDGIGSVCANTG